MKKVEFLRELENTLDGYISQDEIDKVLSKYSDIFDSDLADGKTNDETSEQIGSPAKISRTILENSSSLDNGIKKENLSKTFIDKTSFDKTSFDKTFIDKTSFNKTSFDKTFIDKTSFNKTSFNESSIEKTSTEKTFINKTSFNKDIFIDKNKEYKFRLASMPRRLLAYIVDIIFTLLTLIILFVIISNSYFQNETSVPSQPEETYEQKSPSGTPEEMYELLDSNYNIIEPIESYSEVDYEIINENEFEIKLFVIIFLILKNFLTTLQLWISNGYTIGKYIFGIRVIRLNNKKLTFIDIFMREIMTKTIANYITYSILNIISFIWACSTHEHKTIHDLAVGTKVIMTK